MALVLALAACALGLHFILLTTVEQSARTQAQQVRRLVSDSADPATALRQGADSTQVGQVRTAPAAASPRRSRASGIP